MKETLEEAAERIYDDNLFDYEKYRYGFIDGAKWQAERMYSEEEVRVAIIKASMSSTDNFIEICDEVIEQFKKK